MKKFYYHFAAAYGTIWLVLVLVAVITQSNLNAGQFGLYGFIIIAFLYAIIATGATNKHEPEATTKEHQDKKLAELEDKINQIKNEMMLRNPGSTSL